MEINKKDFDITKFSSYKSVEGQYTDDFIRTRKALVIENSTKEVLIGVSETSLIDKNFLVNIHKPKNIKILKLKDSSFSEFIGSVVEQKSIALIQNENSKIGFSLEDISSDAPIVNIINAICLEAIRKQSSDIHIQNTTTEIKVRLRIDGVLQTVKTFDISLASPLSNRIKVMAGLNVMENRLCQDGRMTVTSQGINYDFRVSIVPCVNGQSIVLRLFNLVDENLTLNELGFSERNMIQMEKALSFKNGMILTTGPTGSGKTTTLHSLLSKMDKEHLKIVTIEDPVEKEVEGIDQIQVNNEIGLTFESILRRVLRQDPDVIMVGEIRDRETAQLAVRAALTGHLILSTLHTNDSVGAITRLRNLGIESYLIADVLKVSLAQRLVRRVCSDCSGLGCVKCSFTGYKGRIAISEVFTSDSKMKELIENNSGEIELLNYLKKNDFKSMAQDGKEKLKSKITTKEELIREGVYEN